MLEHNIHEHVKHSKGLLKKPLVQGAFKQTPENIKIRSHFLHTITNSTREERRTNCTYQYKECSNQSTQNPTEQPENTEDNQWRVFKCKKRGRNNPDLIINRKQPKAFDCSQEDPLPTHNTVEGLEEVSENANISMEPAREVNFSNFYLKTQ